MNSAFKILSSTGLKLGFAYKLENFEGPLDLLLYLIDKNKIDIYDIPINTITDQYLEYMANLDTLDMDLQSSFIVMASNLLSIKAKMMLPLVRDSEEEEDPREELVRRLLEHKKYKNLGHQLKDYEDDCSYQISKARFKFSDIDTQQAEIRRIYDERDEKIIPIGDPADGAGLCGSSIRSGSGIGAIGMRTDFQQTRVGGDQTSANAFADNFPEGADPPYATGAGGRPVDKETPQVINKPVGLSLRILGHGSSDIRPGAFRSHWSTFPAQDAS